MKAIFVTGTTCSGKSVYCESLLNREPRPILLEPGKIMRAAFGSAFFEKGGPPAHPACEHWVRSNVHHAISVACALRQDLVVDGAPRSVDQARWIVRCLENDWYSLCSRSRDNLVEVHVMGIDDGKHAEYVRKRHPDPAQADAATRRAVETAGVFLAIREYVKSAVAEGRRWLSLVEVA